jgi:hypothetical protein
MRPKASVSRNRFQSIGKKSPVKLVMRLDFLAKDVRLISIAADKEAGRGPEPAPLNRK